MSIFAVFNGTCKKQIGYMVRTSNVFWNSFLLEFLIISSTQFHYSIFVTWILLASPLLSMRLATLTVSPQISYWGFLAPITPAITGPWLIPVDHNILVLHALFLFLLLQNILKLRKEGASWNWELEAIDTLCYYYTTGWTSTCYIPIWVIFLVRGSWYLINKNIYTLSFWFS